jgi:hypothetical protein
MNLRSRKASSTWSSPCPCLPAQAALTDLHDSRVDNALGRPDLKPGRLVRAAIIGEAAAAGDKGRHFVLSLRPSATLSGAAAAAAAAAAAGPDAPPETLAGSDLKPGQQVGGAMVVFSPLHFGPCAACRAAGASNVWNDFKNVLPMLPPTLLPLPARPARSVLRPHLHLPLSSQPVKQGQEAPLGRCSQT